LIRRAAGAGGGGGGSKVTVVTSTTVLADLIRNVARERAEVVSLVPAGGSRVGHRC
jgi:ABC-type Zn uptake system ZnuABC Zn-binding protein ZnuA